jgi:hypothetical protein
VLKSSTAIDEHMLQQSSIQLEILETLLQSCSTMLVNDDSTKNKAMDLKKFAEKVREPNCEDCANRSRSENFDVLIQFLL